MPRVELLAAAQAPIAAVPFFAGGDPGPIVAALASVPELLAPTLAFVGAALGNGSVGLRVKEIAILRTSALQRCSYCINAHTTASLDAGLAHDEVRALRNELPIGDAFTDDAERTLIGWIDALAGAIGPVPDDIWAAARAHHSEHSLIEVMITVGATMLLNRFATGFELPTASGVLDRLAEDGLA